MTRSEMNLQAVIRPPRRLQQIGEIGEIPSAQYMTCAPKTQSTCDMHTPTLTSTSPHLPHTHTHTLTPTHTHTHKHTYTYTPTYIPVLLAVELSHAALAREAHQNALAAHSADALGGKIVPGSRARNAVANHIRVLSVGGFHDQGVPRVSIMFHGRERGERRAQRPVHKHGNRCGEQTSKGATASLHSDSTHLG